MLLNLNHKTLTAEKLILEKKKKSSTRIKKMINYAKKCMCTATYILKCSWMYVVQLQSLKPVVGTLI